MDMKPLWVGLLAAGLLVAAPVHADETCGADCNPPPSGCGDCEPSNKTAPSNSTASGGSSTGGTTKEPPRCHVVEPTGGKPRLQTQPILNLLILRPECVLSEHGAVATTTQSILDRTKRLA